MTQTSKGPIRANWYWCTAVLCLSIFIQIQVTLPFAGSVVRINFADLVAPFLGLLIGAFLIRDWRRVIKDIRPLILTAILMVLAFTVSFLDGMGKIDGFSTWALIKFAGLPVLFLYFFVGYATYRVGNRAVASVFLIAFTIFIATLISIHICSLLIRTSFIVNMDGRFIGMTQNANAMGFFLVCALCLCLTCRVHIAARLGEIPAYLLSGLILAGVIFSGSVAALVGAAFAIAVYGITHRKELNHIGKLALAALLFWSIPQINQTKVADTVSATSKAQRLLKQQGTEHKLTLGPRLKSTKDALAVWTRNPIFGDGLGTILHNQQKALKPDQPAMQVHTTFLWLLAETGLFGALAFAVLLATILRNIWRNIRLAPQTDDIFYDFAKGGLLVAASWLIMSLAHELLYQRILWLLLGMAFAASFVHRGYGSPDHASDSAMRS